MSSPLQRGSVNQFNNGPQFNGGPQFNQFNGNNRVPTQQAINPPPSVVPDGPIQVTTFYPPNFPKIQPTQVPIGIFPQGHPQHIPGYVGVIDRSDAERILRDKNPGCFVVRWSTSSKFYVVSFVQSNKNIIHWGEIMMDTNSPQITIIDDKDVRKLYGSFNDFLRDKKHKLYTPVTS